MIKWLGTASVLFCVGAAAFWSPAIALYALKWREPHPLVLTVLQPGMLFLVYRAVLKLRRGLGPKPSAAIFMLLGLWLSGYVAMSASLRLIGQPFFDPEQRHPTLWLLLFTAFPIYTFVMSTYYGSLLALTVATILMIYMHRKFERHHAVLPRRDASA